MPDPKKFKNKDGWMGACMHQLRRVEGKPQDQSVAICLDMWRNKDKKKKKNKKANEVPMTMADYMRNLADSIIYKFSEEEEVSENPSLEGFYDKDISKTTIDNNNFREVLYTGKSSQLVLMSIGPGEDIGDEVHDVDQFFRIEEGEGEAIINSKTYKVKDDSSVIVPAGAKHNFINTGKGPLKLYSIYSPPHHKDGVIHKTKGDAMEDSEHFDGKTTE